jgi:DNA-binding SARP family transcriptional activator/pimeloyl-ACP methyl ester carboxylesterase
MQISERGTQRIHGTEGYATRVLFSSLVKARGRRKNAPMHEPAEPSLRLKLLGLPSLSQRGEPVRLPVKRAYALLAFLALEARAVPRDHLAALLWPDTDGVTGRGRLRRLLYQIEDLAGHDVLETRDGGVCISAGALACDAVEFRKAARTLVASGVPGLPFAQLVQLTRRACEPLLEGLSFGGDEFDDWAHSQRLEHEHLLSRMLGRMADAQRARGDIDDAVDTLERLLRLDAYSEPAYVQRMSLAAAIRDAAGVEAAFTRCADALRAEFGSKPGPATEQAYLQLRELAARPRDAVASAAPAHAPPLDIRFASSTAGTVAYATIGRGSEAIVMMPGFVSHIEIAWEHPGIRKAIEALAERYTVVVFDRRGVGLSERLKATGTVEAAAGDVRTILDAAGIERAWLFGSSEGGPAAIQLATSSPARVSGLILFGAMARGSRADDYPWALPRNAFDIWMERLVSDWGKPANIETFAPGNQHDPAMRAWWARMLRHAASPASLRAVLTGLRDADVRHLLPQVRQRTLVMHRRGDLAVRFEAGEHLASNIDAARFIALDGSSHWWWMDDVDRVVGELTRFIEASP